MNFAVLQRSLDIPAQDSLQRAFSAVPGLTAADAQPLRNDAFGILVKGRSIEHAMALQAALQEEGIDTAVVAESDLPEMAPTKYVNEVECYPEKLIIHDPLGRPLNYSWDDLFLVAAGHVHMIEFNRVRKETQVPTLHANALGGTQVTVETVVDYSTREEHLPRLLVEINLKQNTERFTIVVEKATLHLYRYLGERLTKNLEQNTALFLQDLLRYAPHAAFNRGAVRLSTDLTDPMIYPSKNAFYEEIIWMLWQMRESEQGNAKA